MPRKKKTTTTEEKTTRTPANPAPPKVAAPLSELEKIVDMALAAKIVKGSREDAVLCALKGQELGVPTLKAIQGIYLSKFENDGGRDFCMTAILMRDLVNASGAGSLVPGEMSEELVTLEAVRYGVKGRPDKAMTFRFDKDRAKREGLMGNEYFLKFPAATMLGRLTGEAVRSIFPDVLGGATYTPEEFCKPTPPEATPAPEKKAEQPLAEKPAPKATPKAKKEEQPTLKAPEPPKAEPVKEAPKPELPALTHEIEVQKDGGIKIMRTAGITLAQVQEIGRLCTAAGGMEGYAERAKRMHAMLQELEYPGLQYMTQEMAENLLTILRPNGERVGKGGRTRAQIMDDLCETNGLTERREIAEKLILSKLKIATLDDASERDFQLAVDEINQLMKVTKAGFGIVAERALLEVE